MKLQKSQTQKESGVIWQVGWSYFESIKFLFLSTTPLSCGQGLSPVFKVVNTRMDSLHATKRWELCLLQGPTAPHSTWRRGSLRFSKTFTGVYEVVINSYNIRLISARLLGNRVAASEKRDKT